MVFAIALIVLVVGTVLFHILSPWYFTPIASNWEMMDETVDLTFWVTGTVFVIVNLFLAYSVWKFRHRKGHKAHYEPENKKLEWWLTAITSVGIAAMLAPGLNVWARFVTVPEGTPVVEVRRPAVELELSFPWQGWPARCDRYKTSHRRQPAGHGSQRPQGSGRRSGPES